MASSFDFNKLCETFSEICPDFRQTQSVDKTESLDFANKVLFDLGPKMRQIKQSGNAQMWRLILNGGTSVFIYSYTFNNRMNVNPRVHDKKIYLTLKQAGLLAASRFCAQLPAQYDPRDKILLTPLARAVFLPQNIPKIASAITLLLGCRVDSNDVVKAVISSCQSDGFHLPHSQCYIALVAMEVTTTNSAQRLQMRQKTLKQYAKHGKNFDARLYKIYAQHSKLDARSPDVELPSPSAPANSKTKSIDSIIRGIVKSVDDPLSGGTLEMKYVAAPATFKQMESGLPTPINVPIDAIDMTELRIIRGIVKSVD